MFNEKLKYIRVKLGMPRDLFAEHLGVSTYMLTKWEKGEALPSIEYLPQMAKFLKCEINDFFTPIRENGYDIKVLREFFEFMIDHIIERSNTPEDFWPFLKRNPDIIELIEELGGKLREREVLDIEAIQDILCCSKGDAVLFAYYFERAQIAEKTDTVDLCLVYSDTFEGFLMVTKALVDVCQYKMSLKNED